MSGTQQSNGRSSNVNKMNSAARVTRCAVARQSPDSDTQAHIPQTTSGNATVDSLFDESGNLISAEDATDVEVAADGEFEVEDPEAFLAEVAPDRLESIEAKFQALPGTREELMTYQAQKVIKQAEERGEPLHVESGGELLEVTIHQDEREETVSDVLRKLEEEQDVDVDDADLDECPKCGAEHVSADTVEMQTRAADESGTQLTKTSCGCTFRRTD